MRAVLFVERNQKLVIRNRPQQPAPNAIPSCHSEKNSGSGATAESASKRAHGTIRLSAATLASHVWPTNPTPDSRLA
jgi:hypothetical protein